jgi:hypothetical protein
MWAIGPYRHGAWGANMLVMKTSSPSRLVLVPATRPAVAGPRRFRLARLDIGPVPPAAARFAQVKRGYD